MYDEMRVMDRWPCDLLQVSTGKTPSVNSVNLFVSVSSRLCGEAMFVNFSQLIKITTKGLNFQKRRAMAR